MNLTIDQKTLFNVDCEGRRKCIYLSKVSKMRFHKIKYERPISPSSHHRVLLVLFM